MPVTSDVLTVVRCSGVVGASVGDEVVIMSLGRGQYFGLGGVGPRIWELMEEPVSIEDVSGVIFAEFAMEDEASCLSDIRGFINRLADLGLVEFV